MSTRESAASQAEGSASAQACLAYLARHGLLMKADAKLPSVTTLIAGEPVKASWWAHPLAHTIFFALRDLADHPDVLLLKLVAGKDTFVHRRFWPEVVAIALSNEPWQARRLSSEATPLLKKVNAAGSLECEGPAARLLESRLLAHGIQVHTHEGHHRKRLETWKHWAERSGQALSDLPAPSEGKRSLQAIWPGARWPWS
ncbi:MAG: hypothetical protein WBE76_16585 [Terracidiphilus sp.]